MEGVYSTARIDAVYRYYTKLKDYLLALASIGA
jgi:hypothetical protein